MVNVSFWITIKMTEKRDALFGAHAIIEAIKAKKRSLHSIYTTKPAPKAFERIKKYLDQQKKIIPINYVPREALGKICESNDHMGVVAWMNSYPYQKKFFSPEKFPQILILDGIQDVKNLGAILRSAHCTNFDGVVISTNGCAKVTPATVKASAGLSEHLSIYLATSSSNAIKLAKEAGYNVYLAVLENGSNLFDIKIQKPLCLVIGNEEKGIKAELMKTGKTITLPQKNQNISYNASVAAGILMFNLSFTN